MFSANTPIRDWSSRHVWVIGASEGIGRALGIELQERGARISVSARNEEKLRAYFPKDAEIIPLDVTDSNHRARALDWFRANPQVPDTVFWLPAIYEPSELLNLDPSVVTDTLKTNLISACEFFPEVARYWAQNPSKGCTRHWSWFSSLAAYRGLPNANIYGITRAAISNLAEISHIELKQYKIDISVISPGFVDTRLTQKNSFHMPALITPEDAAKRTLRGIGKGKFETHYPLRLSLIFRMLRLLPISVYLTLMRRALGK
ncbi:MAG: SDR family NAD(P)-dependent oxidoreductase [Betaproteobacteria bacterium]